jgi:3-oxoacyl-[acyl-carrier-protein] synthase-3
MSLSQVDGFRIAGVSTCVPGHEVDNLDFGKDFGADEVRKVVAMAGVQKRRIVDAGVTSADLCFEAAERLLAELGWERQSITGLVLVTQSPDYFLPSSACLIHKWMGLPDECAAFDVGLGCSGYPYGLYLAATMLRSGGQKRVLVLHGETPSRFASPDDHATTLLFGDCGSATALESASTDAAAPGFFCLRTDGTGYDGLIIRGGGFRDRQPAEPRDQFVRMDGAGIFNFTITRVPPMIRDTLQVAGLEVGDVDWYLFHQSNRFIMKHLVKKCGLPAERVPLVIEQFGNSGGPSVALALTTGLPQGERSAAARLMMLGYGVGLSWGAALVELPRNAPLLHDVYTGSVARL